MPTTIRKVLISAFGDISNVNIVKAEIQDPSPNEVQVRVIYSGFNGADINMRLGRYPLQRKAPLTPGYCLVGTVHANGRGSTKFRTGEMVVAMTVYDSEAELANVPEKYLCRVPSGVDPSQACPFVVDWYTAYSMIRSAHVSAGQRVFVHGMSGAVGYATMTLCRLRGATVYGTASEKNHAAIQGLGATPFVYTNKAWISKMQEIGGAHVVFDPLGFESWDESYSILSSDDSSRLVGYGGNSGTLNGHSRSVLGPTIKLFARNLRVWSNKRTSFFYVTRDDRNFKSDLEELFKLHLEGGIRVPIKRIYDLEDIQEAHRGWAKAAGMGSMLVRVLKETVS